MPHATLGDAFDQENAASNIGLLIAMNHSEGFPDVNPLLSALGAYSGFSGLNYFEDYKDDPEHRDDSELLTDGDTQGALELAYYEVTIALDHFLKGVDAYWVAMKAEKDALPE